MTDITVRGNIVTQSTITGFAKKAASVSDMFTVWANAAVLQAAQHGNRNWLDSLFSAPLVRLQNGDLNKTGKQVLSYIQAHFPRVEWDKESQRVVLKKFNAKNAFCFHFAAPGVTLDMLEVTEANDTVPAQYSYKGVAVKVELDKILLPQGDFLLTFDEFCNLPKAEKEDKPEASLKAAAFAKSVTKAIEAHKASKFVGSPEEIAEALKAVTDMYVLLQAQMVESLGAVDASKAAELLQSGQKGRSARAGGKVESAEKVAA